MAGGDGGGDGGGGGWGSGYGDPGYGYGSTDLGDPSDPGLGGPGNFSGVGGEGAGGFQARPVTGMPPPTPTQAPPTPAPPSYSAPQPPQEPQFPGPAPIDFYGSSGASQFGRSEPIPSPTGAGGMDYRQLGQALTRIGGK